MGGKRLGVSTRWCFRMVVWIAAGFYASVAIHVHASFLLLACWRLCRPWFCKRCEIDKILLKEEVKAPHGRYMLSLRL